MPTQNLQQLTALATRALTQAGASPAMADATVRALLYAEARGLPSHGFSRVLQYATHLRNGRANGAAIAKVIKGKAAACLIDADEGLAFPACELAISEAIARAKTAGACFVGVTNSHHFGAAAYHVENVAAAGMVRSGKIMRRILRKIAEGEPENVGDVTTLADPAVVEEIINGSARAL